MRTRGQYDKRTGGHDSKRNKRNRGTKKKTRSQEDKKNRAHTRREPESNITKKHENEYRDSGGSVSYPMCMVSFLYV